MELIRNDIKTFRGLKVYQSAFQLQQQVFLLSKAWPRDEKYSPTDQVRRSSRSIGANLAEAWARRRYPAHFLAKPTDADGELQETVHWLVTAAECGYLEAEEHRSLESSYLNVGGMLGSMMSKHESFCLR